MADDTVRINLNGDLDIYQRDTITALLPDPHTAERVVIDCSQAQTIDSTIISLLLRYRRSFVEAGNDQFNIVLITTPNGRRSLDLSGLAKVMTVITAPIHEDKP